jgi:hypothetical protein
MRGQLERPAEGSVTNLTQGAAVLLLRALVAVFAVNDQPALVDVDVDVSLYVDTRQFQADHCVITVLDDLGGLA